jgi:SHAQKYF class myb-like DNA-binding protein
VTMATAATATPAPSTAGENTGRWTAEEHRLFLQGLEQHGKGWKKIASLIKSRTVVQIRTHAQKYFQKLSKARQNGEEGDVSMEGRGGIDMLTPGIIVSSALPPSSNAKRRRMPTSGTKRKAISSVVASAQREGKKQSMAASSKGSSSIPTLPAVAPALAPYVIANGGPQGTISASALENSLFRYLTPAGSAPSTADPLFGQHPAVNAVARQAGANPIVLPDGAALADSAELSPTGVADQHNLLLFPSWVSDGKESSAPTWFSKGGDVDDLLTEADALDWLADTGDLEETYIPPVVMSSRADLQNIQQTPKDVTTSSDVVSLVSDSAISEHGELEAAHNESSSSLMTESGMPPLPMLFDNSTSSSSNLMGSSKVSFANATEAADEAFSVFDTHFDEQAFVSALLENHGESTGSLPVLH